MTTLIYIITRILVAVGCTGLTVFILHRRGHLPLLLVPAILFWPFALIISLILGKGDAPPPTDE